MSNVGIVASVQARDAFAGPEPFAEVAALPDRTLATQRGGVRVNGIDMDIAVRIETRINDRLQMVSTLLTDAADRITRRTDVLAERLDQAASRTTAATTASATAAATAAATAGATGATSQRASLRPARATAVTAATDEPGGQIGATRPLVQPAQPSAAATPLGVVRQPALSVRHILEGALGAQIVNRLSGQRVQNRIEMTVTLRNYTALRQQAQRIRTLGAALRAAANVR